ncbi:MAG: hypothetical protein KF819_35770 [Labilithrix sp.]|nr:hypothetical protein [Labilithrix sp.]
MPCGWIRTTLVALGAITVLAAGCGISPDPPPPTCADDPSLCPTSTKTATLMGCECKCTIGMFGEGRSWEGGLNVCLPPALNVHTASPEQLRALTAMSQREFDQRAYRYCSSTVSEFLRLAIKGRGSYPISCATPVECECTTTGANGDSRLCRKACADVPCVSETCIGVIRKDETIDMSECTCTRAASCSGEAPGADEPPLCRDHARLPQRKGMPEP